MHVLLPAAAAAACKGPCFGILDVCIHQRHLQWLLCIIVWQVRRTWSWQLPRVVPHWLRFWCTLQVSLLHLWQLPRRWRSHQGCCQRCHRDCSGCGRNLLCRSLPCHRYRRWRVRLWRRRGRIRRRGMPARLRLLWSLPVVLDRVKEGPPLPFQQHGCGRTAAVRCAAAESPRLLLEKWASALRSDTCGNHLLPDLLAVL
mmetsp:Transcript_19291/g.53892  ORF Transcript_19291/g.53892 Transcript_19291/m.53892 type:complete len:200 (-) Transcript_19291:946-1545(-)